LTWIIFSSFSRYIVNILAGEEHGRFYKGEVLRIRKTFGVMKDLKRPVSSNTLLHDK
jgi:hypothetical protein